VRRSALIDEGSVGSPLAYLVREIFDRMPRRRPRTICFQIGTRLARARARHERASLSADPFLADGRDAAAKACSSPRARPVDTRSTPARECLPSVLKARTDVRRWMSVPVSPI